MSNYILIITFDRACLRNLMDKKSLHTFFCVVWETTGKAWEQNTAALETSCFSSSHSSAACMDKTLNNIGSPLGLLKQEKILELKNLSLQI